MLCLMQGKQRALGIVLIWLAGAQNKIKQTKKTTSNNPNVRNYKATTIENKAQKTKHH